MSLLKRAGFGQKSFTSVKAHLLGVLRTAKPAGRARREGRSNGCGKRGDSFFATFFLSAARPQTPSRERAVKGGSLTIVLSEAAPAAVRNP
jgi:hypothetical protein